MNKQGALYVCGTPLGNLEDITIRSINVMRRVQLIAAEDTRHTRKLLARYKIKTPMISLHEHNEESRINQIISMLAGGQDVALVSDAGMPGISDPGHKLICRALVDGFKVIPVPGPSAPIAALSVSGLPANSFLCQGFLPRRASDRKRVLESLAAEWRTLVFFESPHRLCATLNDMLQAFGNRTALLAREITKLHEEFVRGSLSDLVNWASTRNVKGEITLVVSGADSGPKFASVDAEKLVEAVERYVGQGYEEREAIRKVAREAALPKREVYAALVRHKKISEGQASKA